MVEVKLKDRGGQLNEKLIKLNQELDHLAVPLKKSGLIMLRSIDRNFREQGRPKKWVPLSPTTLSMRRKVTMSGKTKAKR